MPPILYATISNDERTAIIREYDIARGLGSDRKHATACAARAVLVRSSRAWNGRPGLNAFAAAAGVLLLADRYG